MKMSNQVTLTMNAGDSFKVKPDAKVNQKFINCTGTIVTVHPTSGCYVVLIDDNQIVLFEHEIELTNE